MRAVLAPAPNRARAVALVWTGFLAVHAWLTVLGVGLLRAASFHDVELYRIWVRTGLLGGPWPVLDLDWVYPVGALAPMLTLVAWSDDTVAFAVAWCVLVTLLDAVALVALLRATRHGVVAAVWWIAALLALGPVAIGRLEGVVAPVVVVALVVAAGRPRIAAALLTAAAWVKVAPGAIALALAATARRPWRDVLGPAAVVSAVVVAAALVGGSGRRVLGFLGSQGSRDLQIEAVAATPLSLARWWDPSIWAELDPALNTYEFAGADTRAMNALLDIGLVVGVAAVVVLARRAASAEAFVTDRRDDVASAVLVLAALATQLVLIVFNKVGSPQYIAWLLPPVAAGLGLAGWARPWKHIGVSVLAIAALTQWLFPIAYVDFLWARGPVLPAAALRNVLLVALLAWVIALLVRSSRGAPSGAGEALEASPGPRGRSA